MPTSTEERRGRKKAKRLRPRIEKVLEDKIYGQMPYFKALCRQFFYPLSELIFEDAFQEFAIKVWRKYHTYQEGRSLKKWLSAVFLNACRDIIRKIPKKTFNGIENLEKAVDSCDESSRREDREIILAALSRIQPSLQGQLLRGFYFEGLKQREVAELHGLPIGTVKSGKHAALQKLRLVLKPENH